MRALLAWEGGDGRGHLIKLKTVAGYLGDRFSFDAALCRLAFRSEIDQLCEAVFACPQFIYSNELRKASGDPLTSTWGEYLGDLGFNSESQLSRRIGWWQKLMRERNISLVIGDFAPCAHMAARGLGIASAVIGTGYNVPPATMKAFPQFLPEYAARIYDEAILVSNVNAAGLALGLPGIQHLPEVYAATAHLAFTLPFLDPYSEHRKEAQLPPIGTDLPSAPSTGNGDEIFLYFSEARSEEESWVDTLADTGVPLRLFMPKLESAARARLAAKGCIIEERPVSVDQLVGRTRLMVHAGSHGIVCMGVGAGIPQVAIPQQLEQLFNGKRIEEQGVAVVVPRSEQTADSIRDAVLSAYSHPSLPRRAVELAGEIRPHFEVNRRKLVRRRLDFA